MNLQEQVLRIKSMMGVINENNQNKPSEEEFIQAIKDVDRKSTRLNSSHVSESRMPSSA